MNRFLTCVLCVLALASAPYIADACSCLPPPPPKEHMAKMEAVFSGTCVDIVVKDFQKICTFEVDRVWKGEVGKTVVVTTAKDGATCGYGFEVKGTYLLYCYGKKGELGTNICTRTTALANAKDDIKELGDGAKPKDEKKEEKK